jgi:hypothetical protein
LPTQARVPIKWNHLIDKDAAQNQSVEKVGIEKVEQFFEGHALRPVDSHLRATRVAARWIMAAELATVFRGVWRFDGAV